MISPAIDARCKLAEAERSLRFTAFGFHITGETRVAEDLNRLADEVQQAREVWERQETGFTDA